MTQRPQIPPPPYSGGCLCGAVRYAMKGRPLAVNACHCTDCKKTAGATNVIMLIADSAAFSATGETHSFRKRADSGRELDIKRCAVCGTRLFHHNMASSARQARWMIPLGSFRPRISGSSAPRPVW